MINRISATRSRAQTEIDQMFFGGFLRKDGTSDSVLKALAYSAADGSMH
jgi:hypothetical protein